MRYGISWTLGCAEVSSYGVRMTTPVEGILPYLIGPACPPSGGEDAGGGKLEGLEARQRIIYDVQRYAAGQQYYVYLNSNTITGSWQPYVKNFAPNQGFDYGNRAAALWLDR